jgi:hypothetical protein
VDIPLARRWLDAIATAVTAQADHLTQLDSAIGDADHGVNLDRGFTAVRAALDGFDAATVGDVFVKAGGTLISKVGGASGPLRPRVSRGSGLLVGLRMTNRRPGCGCGMRPDVTETSKLGGAGTAEKRLGDASPVTKTRLATPCHGIFFRGFALVARLGHNPVGVVDSLHAFAQGSSFLATLGFETESLWDS